MLFDVDKVHPAAYLSWCLKGIATTFGKDIPVFQGHALKRGTVSILKRCGISVEDINLHVGWSLTSPMYATYLRFIMVK
jgi:hypothetical protein